MTLNELFSWVENIIREVQISILFLFLFFPLLSDTNIFLIYVLDVLDILVDFLS